MVLWRGESLLSIVYIIQQTTYLQDDGRCPGAFHVGCQEDPTDPPTEEPSTSVSSTVSSTMSPDICHPANNTLGTCQCDKQLFIGEECSKVHIVT